MKLWEVTLVCVPRLKAVLSAVERTQLDFYGIDRNFLEFEDILTSFLKKVQQAKKQYYGILHQLQRCESADHQSDAA